MSPRWLASLLLVLSCGGGDWGGGIHAKMGFSEEGLRVVEVPPGPAQEAGLLAEDRIVAIDGTPVIGRPIEEVVELLRGPVGSHVELAVLRDGQRELVEVERAPYEE